MGDRVTADVLCQGVLIGADQVDLVAQTAALDGDSLPAVVGKKALQPGKLLQKFRFLFHVVGNALEVVHGARHVLVGACQKHRIQLRLGGRDGNDFDYVFFA